MQTTVEEIFGGAWGMLEARRAEIESGSYGIFDRVYHQELLINFLTIHAAATIMDCCVATARKRLRNENARYIIKNQSHLFYIDDVEALRGVRKAKAA